MDRDQADRLAARLDVTLASRGVCLPCLYEVSIELRRGGRRVEQWVVPTLWVEGLGETVAFAVGKAEAAGTEDAADAARDLESRGPRSEIFRAVVRRLARALEEDAERARLAALN